MKAGKYGTARGTLKKRGRYFYAVWMHNGKNFSVSTKKTTRKEAVAVLADLTADFAQGDEAKIRETVKRKLDLARRERTAIADALQVFLDEMGDNALAETTLSHHRGRFANFLAWMDENRPLVRNADDVTLKDAQAFLADAARGRTAKTFNDYRALFAQIWDSLARAGAVEVNPWKEVRRRERASVSRHEMEAEELARLVATAEGEMKTLFAVGIYTGLRLKDAALLRWRQVDFRRNFLTATPMKTARHGTEVLIPIVEPLRQTLLEAMPTAGAVAGSAYVMPQMAAIYLKSDSALSNRVQAVFKRAGFETAEDAGYERKACAYGFHSLRHTFVSLAFAYGIPLPIVQAIVGHTNAAMTRHYLHLSPAELTAAMTKFKAIPTASAGLLADGNAQKAAEAAQGGAEAVEGAEMPDEGAGASKGLLGAFAGLLAKMDADELEEAARLFDAERARRAAC